MASLGFKTYSTNLATWLFYTDAPSCRRCVLLGQPRLCKEVCGGFLAAPLGQVGAAFLTTVGMAALAAWDQHVAQVGGGVAGTCVGVDWGCRGMEHRKVQ